jgi:hypothetical protein
MGGVCNCEVALEKQIEQASQLSLSEMIRRGFAAGHIKPAAQYTSG